MQYPEHFQYTATGTEKFQFATPAPEGNIRCNDSAQAGTIDLDQLPKVQQQFEHTVCDQFLQMPVQQLALTRVDCRSSPKVENGDIAGFAC